jgi:hypothetical protein
MSITALVGNLRVKASNSTTGWKYMILLYLIAVIAKSVDQKSVSSRVNCAALHVLGIHREYGTSALNLQFVGENLHVGRLQS